MPNATCSVADCNGSATKRGWCNAHYRRWLRWGDPTVLKKIARAASPTCSIVDCGRPYHAKGFCAMHASRANRLGDPMAGGRRRLIGGDRRSRFFHHLDVRSEDECWPWLSVISTNGYPVFIDDGRKVAAHRVALEFATGASVPDVLDVDHLCHNRDASCPGGPSCRHRRCCNPRHLEAVTHLVNVRRANARRVDRTGRR